MLLPKLSQKYPAKLNNKAYLTILRLRFFASFYQAIENLTMTSGTVYLKKQANPQLIFLL